MNKPDISPDFTIDDIHKVREFNYETTKDMTPEARREYYSLKALKVRAEMQSLENGKELVHA